MTARQAIDELFYRKEALKPLDQPLDPAVKEAIRTYGENQEPVLTPHGYMDWNEVAKGQWNYYLTVRWDL